MKVLGVYYFFVMMLLDLGVLNEKMKSFEIGNIYYDNSGHCILILYDSKFKM